MTLPGSPGQDYDVVISGSGLAGSAAAILLARRGVRVALLERRSDPEAYKVLCTHSITANAYPVLDELGLVPALEEAGAVRNDARWHTRWGWIEPNAPSDGPELPHGYNVRRSTLDPLIRSRAVETPGVDLLPGHRVTGLVREAGRTVGVLASTPQGEREIPARLVVGADGKDSAVAKFAGVPTKRYENGRFGYLAHFRGLPLTGGIGQAWFLDPDMAYAFPNDDGVTVLAALPDKKWLPAFKEDLEGSFLEFFRALPEAPPVDSAERVSKIIGTVDYPLHTRRPTAPGIALIGDAALTSDPLWGVGCGWALQTAQWLTDAVAPAATGLREDLDKALTAYARTHRRRLTGHQQLAADYAKSRPFKAMERLMFSAAARDTALARHMYLFAARLIGPLRFLSPVAVVKALVVNVRRRSY
ncbi:NAD(P)/FAD-dependent oxidoreductase [Streptomyces sp. NBC_00257]|uniref:NAD(P)/FAD-dependent oxidoreductase n=1 Tax=unclassified Streptomyces TaxID=2593676 RepID=UPI002251584B|nr:MULTISPECIES: NAD(P)/FAD-dependent oxidoreductase [unclassified Streptomyces]WTB54833.1 NAD(P)/FAD-dependent oxidoreductase [Streptomyces sp. NBC_00826]WTH92281.1 NAD(P)/FAD-dependent oxidoreductase [Streptomyces sp. NBC_00825]WTI01010.1 NAD(P)/FAD-dependent oxidoreductase [Streptomyces sp. NBC_00822]MCX4866577.1 NAD(P)/FAD-dependent oxidoreductase [Streptomyces sp. NBC_00906]MCX4897815.1 NAD(P)/FAD-dependent oxidoreductase [Streptomyces sp. NBC_00892]